MIKHRYHLLKDLAPMSEAGHRTGEYSCTTCNNIIWDNKIEHAAGGWATECCIVFHGIRSTEGGVLARAAGLPELCGLGIQHPLNYAQPRVPLVEAYVGWPSGSRGYSVAEPTSIAWIPPALEATP